MEKPRTLSDINQEYVNLCVKLGDHSYKIGMLKEQVKVIYNQIAVLDQEAAILKKANAEKE